VRRALARALDLERITRLVGDGDKELFRKELASSGDTTVTLPAGLTASSGNKAQLVVRAAGKASAQVTETIRVEPADLLTHLALNKSVYQIGEVQSKFVQSALDRDVNHFEGARMQPDGPFGCG